MIDTIVFDMDGVICHTNPYHVKAFDEFFKRRSLPVPSESSYLKHMYGKSNKYIFSHYLGYPVNQEELTEFEQEKELLFREIYADKVETITGYMSFLEELLAADYKLGVATSAPIANMDLILNKLGIKGHFSSTLASEDVTAHKPDPQVYLKSAKNLTSDPSTCLVFEDSNSGATAGLAAGMKVIGVLSSHTPEELPDCHDYIDYYKNDLLSTLRKL